ncbi:DUF3892 domain-containing protein [Enterococcus hirae]|uniref:DUF3892 domain-containing protein n=1 Tax=Enterococcus sp. AZ078 TaxID=2774710 RepID=UPI002EC7EDAF|nr:DUF3892 domain-containing protein [Enterococcus hirae]EMF0514984.1 DUF3892 domain-containing protein [Enterococcus hirae]
MIKATKIKINDVKSNVNPLIEIKEIYLDGVKSPGLYTKESIYDFLIKNPDSKIVVNIPSFPKLLPAANGDQKYVRSQPNDSEDDNLLKLPRE